MNAHLEQLVAKVRLEEARAEAAREALIRRLRPERPPMRVRAGLALIRVGRWLADGAPKRTVPGRVTA